MEQAQEPMEKESQGGNWLTQLCLENGHYNDACAIHQYHLNGFSALTLLVEHQEEHLAFKNPLQRP